MGEAALSVTPAQVRWFRLRRSGLVDPFPTPEDTARHLIGVQAQLLPASDLAFWNRTANCTAENLGHARLEKRSLVRMWGQRCTVHMFRTEDWPLLNPVFPEPHSRLERELDRQGLLDFFRRLVRRTEKRLERGDELTYEDVRSKRLEGQQQRAVAYIALMKLTHSGVACHGNGKGNQSGFVHRRHWVPDLAWTPPDEDAAFADLARRYLAGYGPAEPRDLGFWWGASAAKAKCWIDAAGCATVTLGDRTLYCRHEDLDELAAKPGRWPVRLLYRFDPLVLATKDKSLLIDDEHYKKVWRPAAHVEPVLLVRGRIAGTWRYDRSAKGLSVRIDPFAPLSRPIARAAEKQAAAIAEFLGLPLLEFVLT